MKINLVGQVLGSSGYSSHCRKLFKELYKLNEDISLNVPLHPGWELQVTDSELACVNKGWYPDGVTIAICMPHMWKYWRSEPCKQFWGFCVWEGDKVPKGFIEHFDVADKILVPSKHVMDAIKNTTKKGYDIEIVPHGCNLPFIENVKPQKFTFLANKGFRGIGDRGGMDLVFKAFSEEFGKDEPVELKCKINPAYNTPQFNLQQVFDSLGLPDDRPPIYINVELVDDKVMADFYSGHVFVAPAKAEAFNLPVLEAMSHGIMPIITGWSGPTEFVKDGSTGLYIDYVLKEVETDWLYEGIKWAEPNLKHLREQMRWCFENQDKVIAKGIKAKKVAEKMTWGHSAKILYNLIKKIK